MVMMMMAVPLADETQGETSVVSMIGVAGEFSGDSGDDISVPSPSFSGERSRPHSGGVEKPWAGVWSLRGAKITS